MKVILNILVLTIFFSGSRTIKADENYQDNAKEKINYSITIDKTNPKSAIVEMSFYPKNDTLYMARGANQLTKRWATFVHNIKAVDNKGNKIPIVELPDAKWKINSFNKRRITVSYEVKLDHQNHKWSGGIDGAAYATDWGVFYTSRSLLVMNGTEWQDITVDFNIPSDWKVTTSWQRVKDKKNSFKVNNQLELSKSLLFAGTHEEISLKRDDFELVITLGGKEVIADKEYYKSMASGVLDYYIELMGGIPNPPPDLELKKSVVIINSSNITDGEVIGKDISILVDKKGGQMAKIIPPIIYAHEFFHLWNGTSFSPSDNEKTEWFKEGFTNYYTLKALYHVGVLNDESFFDVFNNIMYQRYVNDDAVGKLSITNGKEKHAHWGLVYGGGLMVAIAQDMIIRKATNNNKSIDDLMRELYGKYAGTNKGYSMDELFDSLSKLSGKDQSDFFNTYVLGNTKLPIHEYLSLTSFDVKVENNQLKFVKNPSATSLQKEMTKGLFGIIKD